jgi:pyridinium-3,5-bisthiocarboxylic acid mononucleotide nickel chelatase
MKTLYLDIFSGLSGDMFIGAIIDLGVDAHQLERELRKLDLEGYHLHVRRAQKFSISGTKFDVHLAQEHQHGHDHAGEHRHEGVQHEHEHEHRHGHLVHSHPHTHSHGQEDDHHHEEDQQHEREDQPGHEHEHGEAGHAHEHGRNYAQIKELIRGSSLSEWVKEQSIAIFHRIAVAEGQIHGVPPEQVHFHEVGAVDSIVDIVGACVGLELLDKPRVLAAPVVEGTGWINCAHGRFPIPAPATLAILGARGIPISQCEEPHELVTPTGAALLAQLVERFEPMHDLVAEKIGFGLGTRDNKTRPNVVRAILGTTAVSASPHDWQVDTIAVLETNLDDLNPEILGHFSDRALAAGALDVFHTPIQMKKNRPAVLLTVLCAESDADKFTEMMLRETSTFGVRRLAAERRKLVREFINVKTPFGVVAMKIGKLDGRIVQAAPEFEACRQLSEEAGVPLKQVYDAANEAFRHEHANG